MDPAVIAAIEADPDMAANFAAAIAANPAMAADILRRLQQPPSPEQPLINASTDMWAAVKEAPTEILALQVALNAIGWPKPAPGTGHIGTSLLVAACIALPPASVTASRPLQLTLAAIQKDVQKDFPAFTAALLAAPLCVVPGAHAAANNVAAEATLFALRGIAKRVARPVLYAAMELWGHHHQDMRAPTPDAIDTHLRNLGYSQYVVVSGKRGRE